jgi:hypothetical protein
MKLHVAVAVVLGWSLASHADTVLVTPPLSMPGSTHFMTCLANNLDDEPRDTTVEILNTAGSVIVASSGSVNPGQIRGVNTSNLFASYCRITYDGGKKRVRGALTLSLSGLPSVPQVTVPAQ